MHAIIRRALCAMGLAAGIILLGFGLAEAASADGDSGPTTTGAGGILSGNQTGVGGAAPVNVSGNQVTVIGQHNHAASTGTSTAGSGSTTSSNPTTSGQDGIGSGNQTAVGVQAPVNASGNQVTVIGQGNDVTGTSHATSGTGAGAGSATTSGQDGIGSGNQTAVDVQAPVNASGNQVTVIGQDNTAHATGGSSTGAATGSGAATTTGQSGLLAGNQTGIGITASIDVSDNQVTVIGQDNTDTSTATTTGSAGATSPGSETTSGQNGIGSGNQTAIGLALPIAATGNQVTVIGQDNTNTSTGGSSTGGGGSTSGETTTSGQDAVLSGNQTGITAGVPIAATGNQVTVIGQDNTNTSTGGSSTGGGTTPGETTTGAGGIGSGNQTPISVQVPVDTGGNQVTVIGQDNTNTSTSGSSTGGGGGTTPGGATSPPGGGVVNPPTGSTPSGGPEPGTTVLPNTGLSSLLLPVALLGLMLLLAGAGMTRREVALR